MSDKHCIINVTYTNIYRYKEYSGEIESNISFRNLNAYQMFIAYLFLKIIIIVKSDCFLSVLKKVGNT
jgi:hypothetical protein